MVLFTSVRPLERAENLKSVYDAYDGDKEFVQRSDGKPIPGMNSGKYRLVVTDGTIEESPGKYLWINHGMGAGKTVGLQHPTYPFHRSDLVTCAIASSEQMVPHIANVLGISESQVIPLGMPRTDAYFVKRKKKHDKKQYLYAPTFHGYRDWIPDFNLIDYSLTDDEEFIVKPHMVTKYLPVGERYHVVERSSDIPSTDSLVDADVLVTDFSSIMFDAMVLRKPIVLFAKDRYRYLETRGMYCTYPAMYSDCFCDDETDLVQNLRQVQWTPHMEELRDYYAGACDGHSVERCIQLIKDML